MFYPEKCFRCHLCISTPCKFRALFTIPGTEVFFFFSLCVCTEDFYKQLKLTDCFQLTISVHRGIETGCIKLVLSITYLTGMLWGLENAEVFC